MGDTPRAKRWIVLTAVLLAMTFEGVNVARHLDAGAQVPPPKPYPVELINALNRQVPITPMEPVSDTLRMAGTNGVPTTPAPRVVGLTASQRALIAAWTPTMTCESDPSVEVPADSTRWNSDTNSYPDALGIRGYVWMFLHGPTYVFGVNRRPASPLVQITIGRRLQSYLGVPGQLPDHPCGAGYGVR